MPAGKPKYRVVADAIRQRILTGQLRPGDVLPSEAELMPAYGVGRGTARAAIHILVDEKLVSVRQGARPVVVGRVGSQNSATRVFGMTYHGIVPLYHQYNVMVLRGVHSVLADYAHELEMIDVSLPDGAALDGPNGDKFQRCGGIMLMAPEPEDDTIRSLHDAGKILVTLGIPLEHEGLPVHEVTLDGARCMRNLVRHLIDMGHRKFGVVLVRPYEVKTRRYVNQVALGALNEAVHHDGVEVAGVDWKASEFSREAGYQAGMQLLNSNGDRPTAIVATGDTLALGVRQAAEEIGMAVPTELSITGVGNYFPEAEVTTLAVPAFQIGARAAKTLVDACEGKPITPMAPMSLPLIMGKTTTFARKANC